MYTIEFKWQTWRRNGKQCEWSQSLLVLFVSSDFYKPFPYSIATTIYLSLSRPLPSFPVPQWFNGLHWIWTFPPFQFLALTFVYTVFLVPIWVFKQQNNFTCSEEAWDFRDISNLTHKHSAFSGCFAYQCLMLWLRTCPHTK